MGAISLARICSKSLITNDFYGIAVDDKWEIVQWIFAKQEITGNLTSAIKKYKNKNEYTPLIVNHNQMPTVRWLSDICLGSGNNAHFVFTLSRMLASMKILKSISKNEKCFKFVAM